MGDDTTLANPLRQADEAPPYQPGYGCCSFDRSEYSLRPEQLFVKPIYDESTVQIRLKNKKTVK